MLGPGNNSGKGSNTSSLEVPPLPQCLSLEPITLGKHLRPGELRRVLAFPVGSTSEGHSFGVNQPKPSTVMATKELKHIKESVKDASRKAKDRAKMFRESLSKLEIYRENLSSKKRQRTDTLSIERSGVDLEKAKGQLRGSPRDMVNVRLEQRQKHVGLVKRVRTSVADMRADIKSISASRQPAERNEEKVQVGNGLLVRSEEKIRRVAAAGESWERKIKRKRSVSAVGNRTLHGDGDPKQVMQSKLPSDSKLRSGDGHAFRSKTSNGAGGTNKLVSRAESPGSNACAVLKNELEIAPSPRDGTDIFEQRVLLKGNKSNFEEGDMASGSSSLIKGKASRAQRTGSLMVLDSSPSVHPSPGAIEDWEPPPKPNKIMATGITNDKKHTPGATSQPMAQWVGQRPHKKSRLRRANLVSPVVNPADKMQNLAQGFATPEPNRRNSVTGNSGSLIGRISGNVNIKIKKEPEILSPFGMPDSEESEAWENGLKEKGMDGGEVSASHSAGDNVLPVKKGKVLYEMRKQGRSGRGLSVTKSSIPPRERMEDLVAAKPPQSVRLSSDRNKSKSGRPSMKKLKDKKAVARVGLVLNAGSSDISGDLDDDFQTLLAAVHSARNAFNIAFVSTLWKKMKNVFAFVSPEDESYLKQQLNCIEELHESLSFVINHDALGAVVHKEDSDRPQGREGNHLDEEASQNAILSGRFDIGSLDKVTPLYQRILSALIEDESEELYHHNEGKNLSLQSVSDDSHCGSCNQIDIESRDKDRMESEVESAVDLWNQKVNVLDRFSADKSAASSTVRNSSMSTSVYSNEHSFGDDEYSHSDAAIVSEICSDDMGQLPKKELNVSAFPYHDGQYQSMSLDDRLLLELRSIDIHPEILPDLADDVEVINQDIAELREGLYQQIVRKRANLEKVDKAIMSGEDVKRRKDELEEIAMQRLVEMAYRKRMACRGSSTSKASVRKVSKQVALAFIKRTLARHQKYEDTRISCFCEPGLQEILFAPLSSTNDAKSVECVGSGTASNTCIDVPNPQAEARGSGAVSSTFERYDSHGKKKEMLIDDVMGCASSKVTSIDSSMLCETKGKRGERQRNTTVTTLSAGAGQQSLQSPGVESKIKAKPKQKASDHPTSRVRPGNGFPASAKTSSHVTNASVGQSKAGNNARGDSTNDVDEPIDLGNLGLGGNQDLSSFLDFDMDGMQDHDSVGLEVPPWDEFAFDF
ncbi:hypothetical protein BT93_E1963 [Corymbia citriodora subsp. variegata]|nr:hypothetical protein BT93_E1963 [Corymbia citriodora subsp. variegata]KAF8029415.1 hypothetical protein BT93_E1963 [Corymbia citriodora subsp. variegata]KAF8029416.1 hypothetical protein BT93_E1963 [Corymbia citriodora subsp. variegata]